jgi:hypothetical protein
MTAAGPDPRRAVRREAVILRSRQMAMREERRLRPVLQARRAS